MHVVNAMSESKSSMDRSQQDKHKCTAGRSNKREVKHEETVLSDSRSIIATFRMCCAAVLSSEGYFHDSGQSSCQN